MTQHRYYEFDHRFRLRSEILVGPQPVSFSVMMSGEIARPMRVVFAVACSHRKKNTTWQFEEFYEFITVECIKCIIMLQFLLETDDIMYIIKSNNFSM